MREPWSLHPIAVVMSSLLAVDDIAQVVIPTFDGGDDVIRLDSVPWSISVRGLTSGTATLVIKAGDGSTIASKAVTAAGTSTFTPSVVTIAQGDRLRFGFSGVGVGLADVTVTGWLRLPSTV